MPARRTGLDALRHAATQAQPVVALVTVGDVPRAGVSVREFAAIFGVKEWTVTQLVRSGDLATLPRFGAAHHVIPVSEIARCQREWASGGPDAA